MWLGRFLIWLLRPLVCLILRVRVEGKENIPLTPGTPPLVLCCNHISNWDPVVLEVITPRHIHFMAKAELFSNRLFSWFFGKQIGAFPVKRGTGDTGAIDMAQQLVADGKLMGIFPEGTRSKTGELLRPKSGTALIVSRTGAHVLPVAITTKHQKVRLFRPVTVTFGKPLSPEELRLTGDKPELRYGTRALMDAIAALMEASR